ncbi:MAG: pyruvate ferredoxin oxidoreductase alpha subunit [Clostridia bacterium]|nr:pyruvate ferredoxin oxidoreductase alpha subunit [Clostridia bacterium]
MALRRFLNGNEALAEAVKLAGVEVVAAYPITPQSPVVEKIAEFISKGEMESEYIRVESEHAALAACYGAAVTGTRVFTATSSQGLAYMFEMLHYVSGSRMPVVMAVANRGMAAPWTIWADHQDSVSCRDTGWVQLYVENAQEALDTCLQAYKVGEDPQVLLPVMICLDGYTLSHTEEPVEVPEKEEVDAFLPPLRLPVALDVENPVVFCAGAGPELYTEFKYQQQQAMYAALLKLKEADAEFAARFGRSYGGTVEPYQCEDAAVILVTMGAVTGTAREVVDGLRACDQKVGLLKIKSFRPFPAQEIRDILSRAGAVAILERDCSYGYEGALCTEVKAALLGLDGPPKVYGFIGGLGGHDITREQITAIYRYCLEGVQPGYGTDHFLDVAGARDEN